MILQALYEYEKRREALGKGQRYGCAEDRLLFLIEIDEQGTFKQLVDLRENKKGKTYVLPQMPSRSGTKSYEKPGLLWDSIDFVLGAAKNTTDKSRQVLALKLQYFSDRVKKTVELVKTPDAQRAVKAVAAFYEKNENEKISKDPSLTECLALQSCKMSFRLLGEAEPIATLPEILNIAGQENPGDREKEQGLCLVTGEHAPIARIHPSVHINHGLSTGNILVSFQANSGYDSYFKKQGANAPVSEEAAFKYGTALRTLLKSEEHHYCLGSDTYVFWSASKETKEKQEQTDEAATPFDRVFRIMSNGFPKSDNDDPDADTHKMRAFFDSLRRGIKCSDDDGMFCLLGLSPNAARISVRTWKTGSVAEFKANLQQHVNDFGLKGSAGEIRDYSLNAILRSLTLSGKIDDIPNPMSGALLDSVVSGTLYPMTVYQSAISRIRATRDVYPQWAAVVKGCLNRWGRRGLYRLGKVEYKMSLDTNNTDKGYLFGRLFAVIEKLQSDALGSVNSGIRERLYASASTTPAVVFPLLMNMISHYQKKLNPGAQIYYDRLIADIMSQLSTQMPIRLNIIEQGAFALGYYQQKQNLYTKKGVDSDAEKE